MTIQAAIAANRFGLGARPGEMARIGADGRDWLLSQIARPAGLLLQEPGLNTSADAYAAFVDYRMARQSNEPGAIRAFGAVTLGADTEARVRRAVRTDTSFLERWVYFWSNWFTMAARNPQSLPFAGPFEREVVRVHALGRFSDLLQAAASHPGMLLYLDQTQSIGPNSEVARRARRQRGLNENLAREILELHTLGADGGYSQADVTEFARALTGWTVLGPQLRRLAGQAGGADGSFAFVAAMHEPGARTLRGKTYSQTGEAQGRAILADLARDPAVGRRIALRVARHFVADDPPRELVGRLERSFATTGGDLAALARTLVNSPEAWAPEARKFKSPNDFLLSALRAGGVVDVQMQPLRATFEQLGQTPYRAPSPQGWPDTAEAWAAPDAILKRADWANLAAERLAADHAPLDFARSALGPALSERTQTAIRRAESARQGLVLVLMSPEFQRR